MRAWRRSSASCSHARRAGGAECKRWLIDEMTRRVDEAAAAMTTVDRAMGFGVPTPAEIAALCAQTVDALVALPADRSSPDFRMGVADICGGQVSLAVRKRGTPAVAAEGRLAQQYPVAGNVVYAFPPRVARLLDPSSALLPDIQTSPLAVLTEIYEPAAWTLSTMPDHMRVLTPACAAPSFVVPVAAPGALLIVVRIYVAVDKHPFRVALHGDDNEELAGFDAYASESVLLTPIVQCPPGTSRLSLTLRTRWLAANIATDKATAIYTVSLATVFAL